jgi:AcrR family transcriptional regulator
MLDALIRCVARSGYSATSVADVIAEAGVSRRTFYEHFEGKETCYLAAYAEAVRATLEAVGEAIAIQADWLTRARNALRAYLRYVAEHPDSARAFFVEVLSAGEAALARRDAVQAQFADFLRATREEASRTLDLAPLPDETYELLVAGIEQLVAQRVRMGQAQTIPQLETSFLYIELALFADHRTAASAVADSRPGAA